MPRLLTTTPRADGFRMPAEWEPHVGCWMLWPERSDNWRRGAKPAQHAFAAVAAAIAQGEPVTVCASPEQYVIAREMLAPSIRVVEMTSNDSWIRDCGPTFVINDSGDVRAIDWKFNAWGGLRGGLYYPWDQDDVVGEKVAELERDDRYGPDFILEGGSIDVDGEGTVLVTEQCLLNPNRNPDKSRAEIENLLLDHLGAEKILWLQDGVYRDETDGHIDNFCRFVAPGIVVLTWTEDQSDPQYPISVAALQRLQLMRDAKGRPLEVHKLVQPSPVLITAEEAAGVDHVPGTLPREAGDRLAASYVNFYIANDVVIMPCFVDPNDALAQDKLASLFPTRKIVTVPGREILLGGGNVHCITQQEPRGQRAAVEASVVSTMRIVFALGGNALLKRGEILSAENQRRNMRAAAAALAKACDGHEVAIVHGNGPQVGLLALAADAYRAVPPYPLDMLGAESQGMIGYVIAQELRNARPARPVAALLTQTLIDRGDPAFDHPTKPIGPVYDKEDVGELAKNNGWTFAVDGASMRRVVASPKPIGIIEMPVIEQLVASRAIVICCGGGGIPVHEISSGALKGVEAVVDKDFVAALLAQKLGAQKLVILTDVDGVYLDWGTDGQRLIREASADDLAGRSFSEGSMGPKVQAAAQFAKATGQVAVIGSLDQLEYVMAGQDGTLIRP